MEVIERLSIQERTILIKSLPVINGNMDFFVIRFYYHFLRTKAGLLFKHTNIEKQFKMFNTSLNIIITHIADPTQLEDHVHELVKSHAEYGIIPEHVDYFIDSFMKALKEIFPEEEDQEIVEIWHKIISEIMDYFRENL